MAALCLVDDQQVRALTRVGPVPEAWARAGSVSDVVVHQACTTLAAWRHGS